MIVISGEKGQGIHDSHVGCSCNDWNGSTMGIYPEQKTSEDTYSTRHERKPRLHNGTVTEDTDKYMLVKIPPSGREPPDVGLTRIR